MLETAYALVGEKQYSEALPILEEIMEKEPDNAAAINMAGFCWAELGKDATSYQMFSRAMALEPQNKYVLVNRGRALHELGRYEEAISLYLRAAEMDNNFSMAYSNAAASLVQLSKWEDAKQCAELALEADSDDLNAQMNLASCYLALGNLKEGWSHYELSLNSKWRKEYQYGDEGRWDGTKGQTVVVYGEQGLGDEIYFCEAIPDLVKDCTVHIDCDSRLERLFKRSFPGASVHGTRRAISLDWLDSVHIDAHLAMGSLGKFYRNKRSDYPKKPYLTADPEMTGMWVELFQSFGKPVIGICSQAGTKKNNETGRIITEDQWKPFIEAHDAVYVSLDYKGIDPSFCKSYHMATRSSDYDDTASLVAALDCCIGICTSVLHLADALGTPAIHLVPDRHTWKFAGGIPLFETQTIIHQEGRDWKEVLANVKVDL